MKIDITHSQYDRLIDIMADVLFNNLNGYDVEILRMDMERLDNLGASKFNDIGDKAYDIYHNIVEALEREELLDTLVAASIVRMFE